MISQVLDMNHSIAQFGSVLFQAGLGLLRTEIIKNDMLHLYRGSRNRPRSIQGGCDGIFYGSDDKYLSNGLANRKDGENKNACSVGLNPAKQAM